MYVCCVKTGYLYFFVLLPGRGRQYLRWTTPPTSTRFSTNDCSGSGLFCTTLRIFNATVNETGQYQCSYRDLRVEDGKTSVSAYVFVNGITYCNVIVDCSWNDSSGMMVLCTVVMLFYTDIACDDQFYFKIS